MIEAPRRSSRGFERRVCAQAASLVSFLAVTAVFVGVEGEQLVLRSFWSVALATAGLIHLYFFLRWVIKTACAIVIPAARRSFASQQSSVGRFFDVLLGSFVAFAIGTLVAVSRVSSLSQWLTATILVVVAYDISQRLGPRSLVRSAKADTIDPGIASSLRDVLERSGITDCEFLVEPVNPVLPNSGGASIARHKGRFHVLIDADLARDEDAARAIVAHEAGHIWFRHDRKINLFVLGVILVSSAGLRFGWSLMTSAESVRLASLSALLASSFAFLYLARALAWFLSRRAELKCDRFAVEILGESTSTLAALDRICADGLALEDAPWFVRMDMTHPPVNVRRRAVQLDTDVAPL